MSGISIILSKTQLSLMLFFQCESSEAIWATSWKNLYLPYANNKGADQPAHPRSLMSAFVVCCLDSIISLVSILASVSAQAGLSLTCSQTPRQVFSWRGSYDDWTLWQGESFNIHFVPRFPLLHRHIPLVGQIFEPAHEIMILIT